jgi:mycothiol synthase
VTGERIEARIDALGALTRDQRELVRALIERAADADGVRPVSEQALLLLEAPPTEHLSHVLLWAGQNLAGYAQLAGTDPATAELAVADPGQLQPLIDAIHRQTGPGLQLWARGEHSLVARGCRQLGLKAQRVLLQLRRPLRGLAVAPLPSPAWPEGVTVRPFVVGQDEAAWLEVNNEAFAHHPDQSGWTLEDIQARERSSWFDPAGFFLAERAGQLVGFHWTKVHAHDEARGRVTEPAGEPIGEVYVVGVAASMQGQRLGSALTLVGLIHLRDQGLANVLLYVDESNTSAVHVYERLGFSRWDVDSCFTIGDAAGSTSG